MNYSISNILESEYTDVVEVWEASVRATHHFLKEEDIAYYKPLILNEYLKSVNLRCVRNEQHCIIGFLGVAAEKIEMLFIHPDHRGQGIGKTLVGYAFQEFQVSQVDVNEENIQAIGFYECLGFKTVGRVDRDHTRKPYPILQMELNR